MRHAFVALLIVLAGCSATPAEPEDDGDRATGGDVTWHTLYLGPDFSLQAEKPSAGSVAGNGFDEAFLVDEMDEWTVTWPTSMRILGNLTLEYWVRQTATTAPVVVGGEPGEGYHFFNQFGTDRGFVPEFGREYDDVVPMPGGVYHYNETIAMPPGGLHVEAGDTLRLLLTSLAADGEGEGGQEILFGGDTPSRIRFEAHPMADLSWETIGSKSAEVVVPANQGLITGAVPANEDVNHADVPFDLLPGTQRLTIRLTQAADANPLKDDMDLAILQDDIEVTSIGSPYSDEVGTLYAANLVEIMPPGAYTVRVNSYSGSAYEGELSIVQDHAVPVA